MEVIYDPNKKEFVNTVTPQTLVVGTSVPGYKVATESIPQLKYGGQRDADLKLEPDGWLVGDVVDEQGNPVMARVYVDSIMAKTEMTAV